MALNACAINNKNTIFEVCHGRLDFAVTMFARGVVIRYYTSAIRNCHYLCVSLYEKARVTYIQHFQRQLALISIPTSYFILVIIQGKVGHAGINIQYMCKLRNNLRGQIKVGVSWPIYQKWNSNEWHTARWKKGNSVFKIETKELITISQLM